MNTAKEKNMNQETMLHLLDLEKELTTRVESLTADLSKIHSADSGEQAVERENDEVLEQLRRDAANELHKVKHALQRIKEGTYNICEECGGKISSERLKILPFTELCINCADKAG